MVRAGREGRESTWIPLRERENKRSKDEEEAMATPHSSYRKASQCGLSVKTVLIA